MIFSGDGNSPVTPTRALRWPARKGRLCQAMPVCIERYRGHASYSRGHQSVSRRTSTGSIELFGD